MLLYCHVGLGVLAGALVAHAAVCAYVAGCNAASTSALAAAVHKHVTGVTRLANSVDTITETMREASAFSTQLLRSQTELAEAIRMDGDTTATEYEEEEHE
jgi:hypothetical protein